jgi:hypothetical protein
MSAPALALLVAVERCSDSKKATLNLRVERLGRLHRWVFLLGD